MNWAKEVLKVMEKEFPSIEGGRHAFIYDSASDSLVLFLNLYGGFRPIGFTDEEFAKDPLEVAETVKQLIQKEIG